MNFPASLLHCLDSVGGLVGDGWVSCSVQDSPGEEVRVNSTDHCRVSRKKESCILLPHSLSLGEV